MARKSMLAVRQPAVSKLLSLPAPTGGLNARDSLALMQINEAVTLTNLFPLQYGVRVRKGWRYFATGLTGNVETLMVYSALDGTQKMFAAANHCIYDVSVQGAIGAAEAVGFTNNRFQHTNLTNVFGTFIVAVNGTEEPQRYNGTNWSTTTITADAIAFPAFDPKNLIGVANSHRRLWFVEKASGNAWYLPVDVIAGQVSQFHVGEIFPRGGYLQAIGTWSLDSGAGIDDYTVFVSSQGDVAVYSGYDPTDATNFLLVGVYQTGPTLGRRCLVNRGGELLILSESGLVPLSTLLAKTSADVQPLSDKIQQAVASDVNLYGANYGWQVSICSRYHLLLLNVPASPTLHQWAMNTVTGAWCRFENYNAVCWAVFNGEPYFGASGYVGQAWYGEQDAFDMSALVGTDIASVVIQAFNYFGNQALQKRWVLVRPTFNAVTVPAMTIDIAVDFDLSTDVAVPSHSAVTADQSIWDLDLWDTGIWRGSLQSVKNWYSLGRLGYNGALMFRLATQDETTWVATDFLYERGGVL